MSPESLIQSILLFLGEDILRNGLTDTPARVVKSWEVLYGGYKQDPKDILTVFDNGSYDQMVTLKNIEFYSMCEHHMMPFFGKAHVSYIPSPTEKKVVGISKLARVLEVYTRRLQIQERIGEQVTAALMEHLKPLGAGIIIEAKHLCMCSRGVNKQKSIMVTSSLKGIYLEPDVKAEFMNYIT